MEYLPQANSTRIVYFSWLYVAIIFNTKGLIILSDSLPTLCLCLSSP